MARKLRLEYAGAIYHVMNRGDRREPIFKDDEDRQRFISTLGEACAKTGWQIHALCLMPNHFHLVMETPQPNLVAGMKWLLGTYTSRFNRRHKFFGHLFSGRYKALIVDGSGNGYLKSVCDYVHLNPVRAKLLQPEQPLAAYRWSSWPDYLKNPNNAQHGSGWTACWANTRFPKTVLPGGNVWRKRWSCGGTPRTGRNLKPSGAAGFSATTLEAGAARAGDGKDGRMALWRIGTGIGGRQSGADRDGRTGQTPLGRSHIGRPAQRRYGESSHCAAIAAGDDDDAGVDCQPAPDGN